MNRSIQKLALSCSRQIATRRLQYAVSLAAPVFNARLYSTTQSGTDVPDIHGDGMTGRIRELEYRNALDTQDYNKVVEHFQTVRGKLSNAIISRTAKYLLNHLKFYVRRNAQARTGDETTAKIQSILHDMYADSLNTDEPKNKPTFHFNNCLIAKYFLSEWEGMETLWKEAHEKGIKPDAFAFGVMIDGLRIRTIDNITPEELEPLKTRANELWEASKLREDTVLRIPVANAYMLFLIKTGDLESAKKIYTEFKSVALTDEIFIVDFNPLSIMFENAIKRRDIDEGLGYLREMLSRDILPRSVPVSLFSKILSSPENVPILEELLQSYFDAYERQNKNPRYKGWEYFKITTKFRPNLLPIAMQIAKHKSEANAQFNSYEFLSVWLKKQVEALNVPPMAIDYGMLINVTTNMPFKLSEAETLPEGINLDLVKQLEESGTSKENAYRLALISNVLSDMQKQHCPPGLNVFRLLMKAYSTLSSEPVKMLEMVFNDATKLGEANILIKGRAKRHPDWFSHIDPRTWGFYTRNLLEFDAKAQNKVAQGETYDDSAFKLLLKDIKQLNKQDVPFSSIGKFFYAVLREFYRIKETEPNYDCDSKISKVLEEILSGTSEARKATYEAEFERTKNEILTYMSKEDAKKLETDSLETEGATSTESQTLETQEANPTATSTTA